MSRDEGSDGGQYRRHVLRTAAGGVLSLPAVGVSAAEEDRKGQAYDGGGSISSPEELASAITTDEFYDEARFFGNFAQAEVFTTPLQGYPTDGDSFGVISSGVAERAPGDAGEFESTFFFDSEPLGEIPSSPTGDQVNDPAALELRFTVPETAENLEFTYTFGSEEFPEFVGSTFQDFFVAELRLPDGTTENIARLPNGAPVTVDNAAGFASVPGDVVYDGTTGQIDVSVDVSAYRGEELELTLAVADASDSVLDSAVFLDGLSLGDPLGQLIAAKRETINAIQSEASAAIGSDEAERRVDQRAESLVDDIEADAFDAETEQYLRALRRMNATESVTEAATATVTGDDSPTNTVLRDLYSLVTGAAIEFLPEALEGIVGRVVGSILDDVVTKVDDLAGSLSGRGVIPSSSLDDVDDSLNAFKMNQASTVNEYVEENPEDAKDIVESAGQGGLITAKRGAEEAVGLLNDGRSIQDVFEELYFEGYYFEPDWPEVAIPVPDEIELPNVNYSYDVPDEELPDLLQGAVPDTISFDIDSVDIEVPDGPGVASAVDLLAQVGDIATPAGIDKTIDDRMGFIENNIGSLDEQDDALREEISSTLSNGIEGAGELTDGFISLLEDVQGALTTLADLTTVALVLTVVGAGVAVLTGFGTLGLLGVAATLATVATAFSVLALIADGLQVAVGQGYLAATNLIHHVGTFPLAETDLGGVN